MLFEAIPGIAENMPLEKFPGILLLYAFDFSYINLLHCVSKNDNDVAYYNFNAHQQIFVIFGKDVAERVCYQMMICYPTSPSQCFCTSWGNMNVNPGNCVFSVMQYTVCQKQHCFGLPYLWQSSTSFNNCFLDFESRSQRSRLDVTK